MRIALLLSYYNRPKVAELSLHSISLQTRKPDELIVLDDASDEVLPWGDWFVDVVVRNKVHEGFGKERLSNCALLESRADYVVILDSDCIIPPDWLETHERIAKYGQAIRAMYTFLNEQESKAVTKERISNGWVWEYFKQAYGGAPAIWCGAGSAVWRKDALAVNGFDTRFGVTGPDYNFGLRLEKLGVSFDHFCNYGRYFHLHHEKPWCADLNDYKSGDTVKANSLARLWAEEDGAVTSQGIAEQDMSTIEVIRRGD